MRLIDYIESDGISLHENIYLINNNRFPGTIHQCINWNIYDKLSLISRLYKKITTRFLLFSKTPKKTLVIKIPKVDSALFFGRLDRSLDDVSGLEELFIEISKHSEKFQYSVLVGKGDYDVSPNLINHIPPNISKLFLNNLNVEDERLEYFPMGRDFRSRHLFEKIKPQSKDIFLYCNFSINTHPTRKVLFDVVKQKDFITFDHMGDFLKYELSREEFYTKLASSKFALCPRGNAIDTFRLWDSLYLGTVPIVIKEAVFHKQLSDLPILFVDSLEDLLELTYAELENQYLRMLYTDWNYEKLKLSYWISRVKEPIY